jgi:hypothetical protein
MRRTNALTDSTLSARRSRITFARCPTMTITAATAAPIPTTLGASLAIAHAASVSAAAIDPTEMNLVSATARRKTPTAAAAATGVSTAKAPAAVATPLHRGSEATRDRRGDNRRETGDDRSRHTFVRRCAMSTATVPFTASSIMARTAGRTPRVAHVVAPTLRSPRGADRRLAAVTATGEGNRSHEIGGEDRKAGLSWRLSGRDSVLRRRGALQGQYVGPFGDNRLYEQCNRVYVARCRNAASPWLRADRGCAAPRDPSLAPASGVENRRPLSPPQRSIPVVQRRALDVEDSSSTSVSPAQKTRGDPCGGRHPRLQPSHRRPGLSTVGPSADRIVDCAPRLPRDETDRDVEPHQVPPT